MSHPRLLVSFWNICLDNLPEGAFSRRRVTPVAAKALIDRARQHGTLIGATQDDLFAPHKKYEKDNHAALQRVVSRRFGIKLSMKDFCSEDEGLFFANPLTCFQLEGRDRLMIVTCSYSMEKPQPRKPLSFRIAPDTVEFHVIQAIA